MVFNFCYFYENEFVGCTTPHCRKTLLNWLTHVSEGHFCVGYRNKPNKFQILRIKIINAIEMYFKLRYLIKSIKFMAYRNNWNISPPSNQELYRQ